MWTDNETDQDLLGFAVHAELLRSVISDSHMLPVTVGLFGDWGSGKSSILKMLKRDLETDDRFAVIYFNTWVFEGYDDAKSAILSTLLKELRDHRTLKNVIGDEASALLRRVNWMKVFKLSASAGLSLLTANPLPLMIAAGTLSADQLLNRKTDESAKPQAPDLKFDDLLAASQESIESVRSFRRDFQEMIDKTKLRALVILVDDLDRCSPERLVENLEAIKLFLNVDRTAFVVATDRRIVENAIRIRYSELYRTESESINGESLITDYLEKLIQVPYTLPKLAPHEVRSYLCMLFLRKYLSESDFAQVLLKYVNFVTAERYATFQYSNELVSIADDATRKAVTESMRLVEACSDAITDGLKGNPRQIKRFLNAFWLRRELASVAHIPHLRDHLLIKLMVLEYVSSDRFEELYQWHRSSSDGIAGPIAELEKAERADELDEKYKSWGIPKIWRWLKTDPRLASEDLRDYFWVSRSSISDSFSGVRLMTQAMRICTSQLASNVEVERKSGVVMFASLSEDEQAGVLGKAMRHAIQEIKDDAVLRSLIDLAHNGHINAAEAFAKCVDRIGAGKLSPGFGISLRAFKVEQGSSASKIVERVREKLSTTSTPIGRALKPRTAGKK